MNTCWSESPPEEKGPFADRWKGDGEVRMNIKKRRMAPNKATEIVRKNRMLRLCTDICGIIDNKKAGNHSSPFDGRGEIQ